MKSDHSEDMNEFYQRKWQGHSGYWLDIFPIAAQVYASSLGTARNRAIVEAVPNGVFRVLDIGCGVGDLVKLLSKKSAVVVGVDIADVNVKLARQNLLRDQLSNTAVVQGSAEQLAFCSSTFDTAIMADVIEHVRDVQSALTEIARILRPGGLFICVTPHPGVQSTLVVLDLIARLPIRVARVLLGRSLSGPETGEVFERFLSREALKAALIGNGLTPLSYSRICFYPGPEGGGIFGRLMGTLRRRLGDRRFMELAEWIVRRFDSIERLQLFNQKQIWIAQRC